MAKLTKQELRFRKRLRTAAGSAELYDILSALRGPDNNMSSGAGLAKRYFTGPIRWMAGVAANAPAIQNPPSQMLKELKYLSSDAKRNLRAFLHKDYHFTNHTKNALRRLYYVCGYVPALRLHNILVDLTQR